MLRNIKNRKSSIIDIFSMDDYLAMIRYRCIRDLMLYFTSNSLLPSLLSLNYVMEFDKTHHIILNPLSKYGLDRQYPKLHFMTSY